MVLFVKFYVTSNSKSVDVEMNILEQCSSAIESSDNSGNWNCCHLAPFPSIYVYFGYSSV
ncbi:hypothetical protein BLOT_011546 [Blomia tropicalis]|nr:hypothetical protein BLOT_011546 [Blomia tropicalis]